MCSHNMHNIGVPYYNGKCTQASAHNKDRGVMSYIIEIGLGSLDPNTQFSLHAEGGD